MATHKKVVHLKRLRREELDVLILRGLRHHAFRVRGAAAVVFLVLFFRFLVLYKGGWQESPNYQDGCGSD